MRKCDIVVPVYNAYDFVKECVESVLKNTDFSAARLILINDKSSDERIGPLLEKYAKKNPGNIIFIENEENLGFVKTANKGMRYSQNDVVLLNSDAKVSERWLEKMMRCADEDEKIATVTPLSNNKTPVRLPEIFRERGYPEGFTFEKMASLVENCSMRLYPDIPSAHGFCMLIKREAIEAVGYFDEENFGKGYGEENDFCFRCFRKGFRHVLCDDVYVLHAGAQSFLDKKEMHDDTLRKMHPEIRAEVDYWYQKRDLDMIVDNVVLAIGAERKKRNILLLADGEKVDDEKIREAAKRNNVHVLLTEKDCYLVRSFFGDLDLITAIYMRPLLMEGVDKYAGIGKRMLDEVVKIFGISEIRDETEKSVNKLKGGSDFDFGEVRRKMLDYELVKNVVEREKMREMRLEKERKKEEAKKEEWRKNLTFGRRVYLKARYILLGR